MDAEPVGPLFLLDGGDVIVIADHMDARRQLEPFLVDEPVVEVDGRETVGVELTADPPDEQRLRDALSNYLLAAGLKPPSADDIGEFALAAAALI